MSGERSSTLEAWGCSGKRRQPQQADSPSQKGRSEMRGCLIA